MESKGTERHFGGAVCIGNIVDAVVEYTGAHSGLQVNCRVLGLRAVTKIPKVRRGCYMYYCLLVLTESAYEGYLKCSHAEAVLKLATLM